ncbi:uncharacterized protein MONBRDRAFT_34079 [Monosiga brevicollis MX1]|uniref:peptidylprolyl isomerase n=1 Tax=Monosiga brevicollis TaxID=81824 RepID=A9V9C7_MONBE|nr:uncharacterized protein MONBRDRAFT_34079 [Monosiga brevicollis MX1]EDQ85838.1 predicted protein [Monosiga brevicollis MX1]|eukprot:XP_001749317.1 hypothetical protein [Monosiga brevicollis MX1]
MMMMWRACLVALGALAVLGGVRAEKQELIREVVEVVESCETRVQKGDEVAVVHVGYYNGQQIDGVPRDENGNAEPLRFKIGNGEIIEGMEVGLLDTCLGEKVRLTIPPHMAFDDGRKQFRHKPVPSKATVIYEIEVVGIDRPGTLKHTTKVLYESMGDLVSVGLVVLMVGGAVYVASRNGNGNKKRTNRKKRN